MSKLIEVFSVSKSYKTGQQEAYALRDVSFSINSADYLSIVGPSGAGKSTLLHVLGGLETPTQGKVIFRNKDVYKMRDFQVSLWRNNIIGFVFQFYHLIEELNIIENVALSACLGEVRKFSFKRALELLKYLGVEGKAQSFPSQLSGGEKQKVAIARALINDPQIILCDEPTGNLDKDSQNTVIELLEQLHKDRGKSIITVTHNLELASRAKRILFIKDGEIVKETVAYK